MYRRLALFVLCAGLGGAACAAPPPSAKPVAHPASASRPAALEITSRERWRVPLPSALVGIPSVGDDAIFVSTKESVVALAHDGAVLWSEPMDQPRVFAPVADGELVFVAGPHWLAALQRKTGALVWQFDTGAGEGVRVNRPAIARDVVVAITDGGRIIGVDRATGTLRWESAFGAGSGAANSGPRHNCRRRRNGGVGRV